MNKEDILKKHSLPPRPYQEEAIHEVFEFTKKLIRKTLEERVNVVFSNSSLLEMAT
jgi:hypothetical protein